VVQRVSFETDRNASDSEAHSNSEQSVLTEDDLILLALENNKLFQAATDQLGMFQGDLVQAGLLTNPNFSTFLQVGVKQWEWTLFVPIEAFLLRPHREGIAHADYHRVANDLVQNGLTLVRDVRVAYADFALATEQLHLAEEALQIRNEIDSLTQKRLEGGDIGELESRQAKIDAITAKANIALLRQNVDIARNRIHTLIGLPYNDQPIDATLLSPALVSAYGDADRREETIPREDKLFLISRALASRPDMRAANWAVDAAARRSGLARWMFWRVDAGADANQQGRKGYEVGPAFRFDVPIFNRNQGGRMRANSEWRQAVHNRDAVHDRIIEEVRTAAAQLEHTQRGLAILTEDVVPSLAEAIQIARKGYEDGGADYLLVLQTTTQYLTARATVLDQTAALRRAQAELERSIAAPLETVADEVEVDGPVSTSVAAPLPLDVPPLVPIDENMTQ
jgi:cobalt-zinc-cadmium efflux system outer membrane protein